MTSRKSWRVIGQVPEIRRAAGRKEAEKKERAGMIQPKRFH